MHSREIPVTEVYCSQVRVEEQSKGGLQKVVFDLANLSTLRIKLSGVLKAQYGDMYFDFDDSAKEKMIYTMWAEPYELTVRHKGGWITYSHAAEIKAILSGNVDVYVNDINVDIVMIDGVFEGKVTIGHVDVRLRGDLSLY